MSFSINPPYHPVISLLTHPNLPPAVLRHDLISLSLLRLWKFGTLSSPRRLLEACDAIASPRWESKSSHIHLPLNFYQISSCYSFGFPSPFPRVIGPPGVVSFPASNTCRQPWWSSRNPGASHHDLFYL